MNWFTYFLENVYTGTYRQMLVSLCSGHDDQSTVDKRPQSVVEYQLSVKSEVQMTDESNINCHFTGQKDSLIDFSAL